MNVKNVIKKSMKSLRASLACLTLIQISLFGPLAGTIQAQEDPRARTPIKHVIVIIGENRTFDHVFATYKPKPGQTVSNLLSKGIIHADGTHGANYALSHQFSAVDFAPNLFDLSPKPKTLYPVLPAPLSGGPKNPYIPNLTIAHLAENGLDANYYQYLITGGTGLNGGVPDTRIPNVNLLAPGPFQITAGVPYDAYAASPVHRFYQMWQQFDCNVSSATADNPSGCKADLFPWVEVTIGAGSNGLPQANGFNNLSTGEGSTAMGFYNVQQGDAPYLTMLADSYAMSDNFHQSVMGGTGANHVELGSGDAIWYSDGKGHAMTPPMLNVENPNPAGGTNNWYSQDGYSGGTYSNCADSNQPGVDAVEDYLKSLEPSIKPNCEAGHFYLLNNYAPGYFGDGTVNSGQFAIPPSTLRTIGDELVDNHISWKYYGDQWNLYVADPNYNNPFNNYCDICNPFQYSTSIMTNPTLRSAHIQDTLDLYADIAKGYLPAVSFVKPSGIVDGHPASSKLDLFEGFVKKIVDMVHADQKLSSETAIFITFDEGGGYYDSGYIQPLDFFGDGTRIPMIVVSPFSTGGIISHSYSDHVSILKFIEKNWGLPPVTSRSRDNFPNPIVGNNNPYVPTNSPAISDLMDFFNFSHHDLDAGDN